MEEKYRKQLAQIPPDVLDEFFRLNQRHSYSAHLDAFHAVRSVFRRSAACSKTDLIIISGQDETDSTGRAKIPIDPLLCGMQAEGNRLVMVRNPVFVATAQSDSPVYVTSQVTSVSKSAALGELISGPGGIPADPNYITDVDVKVFSWKSDGTPAMKAAISWICTIEAAQMLLIGG